MEWQSGKLEILRLTEIRKNLIDLEINCMSYACGNIKILDISGSFRIKPHQIVHTIHELDNLEGFIALRCPHLGNEIL